MPIKTKKPVRDCLKAEAAQRIASFQNGRERANKKNAPHTLATTSIVVAMDAADEAVSDVSYAASGNVVANKME